MEEEEEGDRGGYRPISSLFESDSDKESADGNAHDDDHVPHEPEVCDEEGRRGNRPLSSFFESDSDKESADGNAHGNEEHGNTTDNSDALKNVVVNEMENTEYEDYGSDSEDEVMAHDESFFDEDYESGSEYGDIGVDRDEDFDRFGGDGDQHNFGSGSSGIKGQFTSDTRINTQPCSHCAYTRGLCKTDKQMSQRAQLPANFSKLCVSEFAIASLLFSDILTM